MDSSNPTRRRGRPPKVHGTECHTCIERRQKCDGARPCCKNCQMAGNICGGFTVELSWQPGFSTTVKPTKRSITRRSRRGVFTGVPGRSQMRFVQEYSGVVTTHPNSSIPKTASFLELAHPDLDHAQDKALDAVSLKGMENACMPDGILRGIEYIEPLLAAELSFTQASERQESSQHSHHMIPASVLYNGHFERFEPIIDRCGSSLYPATI